MVIGRKSVPHQCCPNFPTIAPLPERPLLPQFHHHGCVAQLVEQAAFNR